MIRRMAAVAGAVAMGLSGVALTAGNVSAMPTPPVNASGSLHCAITGKVKIVPPLLFGGASPSATFTAKVKSTSCTGTSGVTSVKGTFSAVLATNDCIGLAALPFPMSAFGPVKYKGAAKYNTSTVSFTSGAFTVADPILLSAPGGGTSSVASGSFVGQQPSLTFAFEQPAATFATNCQAKTKGVKGTGGLKKMTFSGSSSFDIS